MNRAVETLAKIDLFRSLSPEEIRILNSRCIWRRAKPKEWILEYRDDGKEVFFLTSGSVRVMIQVVGGRETILRDIYAGDFFGEVAAIDGQNRSASILALTEATIARMRPSTFVETIIGNPGLVKEMLIRMAAQTRSSGEPDSRIQRNGHSRASADDTSPPITATRRDARSPVSRAKSRSPGRAGRDATRFHQQGIAADAKGRIDRGKTRRAFPARCSADHARNQPKRQSNGWCEIPTERLPRMLITRMQTG